MDLWRLHYPVVVPRRTDFYCILNMITQAPKEDASLPVSLLILYAERDSHRLDAQSHLLRR